MAAATKDRNTTVRDHDRQPVPVAAGETIYAGTLVGLDASGFAMSATDASTTVVGIAEERADNADGANSDITVVARRTVALLENDVTNPVVQADIGGQATVVDDQTVATPGGVGPNGGRIFDLGDGGVWVDLEHV